MANTVTDFDSTPIARENHLRSSGAETVCPLCSGCGTQRFTVHAIPILDCAACGHRYAGIIPAPDHVADVYGDDYFFGGGAGYSDYTTEERLLRNAGRKYVKLLSRWLRSGSLLDVGAAAGFILQGFCDAGWTGTGVEPNARMAAEACRRFGLDVVASPFEHYRPGRTFDVVTMFQVIAHFPDPAAALRHAASLLRPGGLLLVETWNYRSRTASLLSGRWHEYSPPSVLHWFSPESLGRLAGQCGLRRIHRGTPLKWIDAGHAVGLLGYKFGRSSAGRVVRAIGSLLPKSLPVPYPSEDLFWMVFRRDHSEMPANCGLSDCL